MRISHSQKNTHKQCSEKWRLHYRENLRSPKLYSSLFFGGALDEAFSILLLQKKKLRTPEEQLQLLESPDDVFYRNMLNVKGVNGEVVEVSKNPFADYYSSDFTPELLNSKALSLLREYAPDVALGETDEVTKETVLDFMESCKNLIKAKKKLSAEDVPVFNYINWLTLVEKGYLMIEAYRTQIMPQIFEVYSIQEDIEIKNEAGDVVNGKIDVTLSFIDEPGVMYITDNKSSSKPYKKEQTGTSDQLATYCEAKGTNKAAYVVIEKVIYKKAPIIHTQILKADLGEAIFAQTFSDFEQTVYNINTGVFEKNFKACFSYGRLCPFFAKCKHGNSEGLIKKEDVPVE